MSLLGDTLYTNHKKHSYVGREKKEIHFNLNSVLCVSMGGERLGQGRIMYLVIGVNCVQIFLKIMFSGLSQT
jgi:hypothetical protein